MPKITPERQNELRRGRLRLLSQPFRAETFHRVLKFPKIYDQLPTLEELCKASGLRMVKGKVG